MKQLRYAFLLTALCCAALIFACAAQAGSAPFTISVQPFEDESTKIDWWYCFSEDRYYLFLPAGTDTASLRLFFTGDELTLNGEKVKNGKKTGLLTANAELTAESGGETYALTVLCSERIPAVFIHTASGSLDEIHRKKENKEAATLTLAENGGLTLLNAPLKHIKGRGNTTWYNAIGKRPYNIRFEEKTDLLGMGAAKKWSLLANYFDDTLLRNTIALDAARRMEIPYAVDCRPVDLYINGGYLGNYLVCESVQVDPERVDIRDMEKENEAANPGVDLETVESEHDGEPGVITEGTRQWSVLPNTPPGKDGEYLLELDLSTKINYEPSGFFSSRGQCVIIKSPEHATESQVNRIADIYQAFEDAMYAPDGVNAEGKSWLDYIDLPSFVNCYMLLEYTMDADFTRTSFFMTLDEKTEVFKAGPAWDFDIVFGNFKDGTFRFLNPRYAEVWSIYGNEMQQHSLFYCLLQFPAFRDAAKARWAELSAMMHGAMPEAFVSYYYENRASALMNFCRWELLPGSAFAEKARYYEQKVWSIWSFLGDRASALDRGFKDPAALTVMKDYIDERRDNEMDAADVTPAEERTMPPDPLPPVETPQAETTLSAKTVALAAAAAGLLLLLLIPVLLLRKQKKKEARDDGEAREEQDDGEDREEQEDRDDRE